jgi:Protein of unknown function (DUF4058)
MPSPFPGMDPYLEAADIWPDFHEAFASEIRAELNLLLPQPYYARLEVRPEVGIVDDEVVSRRIVPDVTVVRTSPDATTTAATATLSERRTTVSASVEVTVASEPLRHQFVEIRDARRGHKLITLMEIVSPANKRPGADRRAYLRKQRDVLESDASLVEIDLLRTGERLLPNAVLAAYLASLEPQPAYFVLVNRAWQRVETEMVCQLFTVSLRDVLPCIPIPLREGEDEVKLDVQWVFNQAYDRGPYSRGAVDYGGAPEPPLEAEDVHWLQQRLGAYKLRS